MAAYCATGAGVSAPVRCVVSAHPTTNSAGRPVRRAGQGGRSGHGSWQSPRRTAHIVRLFLRRGSPHDPWERPCIFYTPPPAACAPRAGATTPSLRRRPGSPPPRHGSAAAPQPAPRRRDRRRQLHHRALHPHRIVQIGMVAAGPIPAITASRSVSPETPGRGGRASRQALKTIRTATSKTAPRRESCRSADERTADVLRDTSASLRDPVSCQASAWIRS